jgi:hypothetical protein
MYLKVAAYTFVALSGCSGLTVQDGESWRRPPPIGLSEFQKGAVDIGKELYRVRPDRLTKAVYLLKETSIVPVDRDLATDLIGQPLEVSGRTRLYLVRALQYGEGTGRFYAMRRGTEILVHHGVLGRGPDKPVRAAVILGLDFVPTELYVSSNIAE